MKGIQLAMIGMILCTLGIELVAGTGKYPLAIAGQQHKHKKKRDKQGKRTSDAHHRGKTIADQTLSSSTTPKQLRLADTEGSIAMTAAIYNADVKPRKVVKYASGSDESICIIYGVPANKAAEYQEELTSRQFATHRAADGTIIGTRKGRMDTATAGGNGILFTALNNRKLFVAFKGNTPSALAAASKCISGQDPDFVLFNFQPKEGQLGVEVAEHLKSRAGGQVRFTKKSVHLMTAQLQLPGSEEKFTDRIIGSFRKVPTWIWILLLLLFPLISGMGAISIINAVAASRQRRVVRL
jgi:hypothetical protein